MRHLSKKSRNRLLWIASVLDGMAARLRAYAKARTPRRGSRGAKDAQTLDMFEKDAA